MYTIRNKAPIMHYYYSLYIYLILVGKSSMVYIIVEIFTCNSDDALYVFTY